MLSALSVIPGRAEGASPESITTILSMMAPSRRYGASPGLWIPGSPLRGAPE